MPDLSALADRALEYWNALPVGKQLLHAGTGLLLLAFATLMWTPFGNRRAALKCLVLALLLHLLAWGFVDQYSFLLAREEGKRETTRVRLRSAPRPPASPSPFNDPEPELEDAERLSPRRTQEEPSAPARAPEPEPRLALVPEEPRAMEVESTPAVPRASVRPPQAAALLPDVERTPVESPRRAESEPIARRDVGPGDARRIEAPVDAAVRLPVASPKLADPKESLAVSPGRPGGILKAAPAIAPAVPTPKSARNEARAQPKSDVASIPRRSLDTPREGLRGVMSPDARLPASLPTFAGDADSDANTSIVPEGSALGTPGRAVAAPRLPPVAVPGTPASSASQSAESIGAPESGTASNANSSTSAVPGGPEDGLIARRSFDDGPGMRERGPAPASGADLRSLLGSAGENGSAAGAAPAAEPAVPRGLLGLRSAPDRLKIVLERGGTTGTELAVRNALDWLAAHQDPAGFWDSDGFLRRCPAGDVCTGPAVERGSDTGLTGLALLAFLGAGKTHQSGDHQAVVRRGLDWLASVQGIDGDLRGRGGEGRIYCHAMASLALTEAYALTGDPDLRQPALKAIRWLISAQHPAGGWRYAPGQPGDTSVFGWAVLALRSAKVAGLSVPDATWERSRTFVQQVRRGRNGGLAAYMPGHAPTHAMTAELMVCQQVLGMKADDPAMVEASSYILGRLPDAGDHHIYYWYYGTLGLFQLGGESWQRWNDRLTQTLLATQQTSGHRKGSWDPRTPFGTDGGRVFSTAASALCLEVYYRYLPLYETSSTVPAAEAP